MFLKKRDLLLQGLHLKPLLVSTIIFTENVLSLTTIASLTFPLGGTKLASRPRLHELDRKEGNGKTVKLINRAAADWEQIATRLHFEVHEIRSLRANHRQTLDACREMFMEWLEGKGRSPKTWETVIEALEEADLSEAATDLKDVL